MAEPANEERPEPLPYEVLEKLAYKAPLDENGVAILPADWDDEEK